MANPRLRPKYIADHIRRVLKDGGSAPHAEGMQWFFKEEIKSRGWYRTELRKVAVRFRRTLIREVGLKFLIEVADELFSGSILEEKILAVFLLEKLIDEFGDGEFSRFASWLDRISSWADHDALVHCLIAPMLVAKLERSSQVFRWAKSRDRWHRRAACVALIRGTRRRLFFPEIKKLAAMLLVDEDDMVQKGLGWLLRETAKANARSTVPFFMKIRKTAPRVVLRTACETLPASSKKAVLG